MAKRKAIEKNRTRYRTVAFRCSDAELAELNKRVDLSGLQKQDYLIKSVLNQEITVIGNALLFEKLQRELADIQKRIGVDGSAGGERREEFAALRTVAEMLSGFQKQNTGSRYSA